MNREWIDVSVTVKTGMVHWPGDPACERKLVTSIDRGDVANVSQLSCCVHLGTHMDAPRHFLAGGPSMESMPIQAGIGRAKVIEIHDPEVVRIAEIEPYRIAKGDRVLFKTRNSSWIWKTDEFQKDFVYIPPDTAEWLAAIGIQTVGVDYLSVGGFYHGGPETHRALLGAGVWVIEGLNLENVAPGDYELVCLPLKILGSDGAPARAVLRRL